MFRVGHPYLDWGCRRYAGLSFNLLLPLLLLLLAFTTTNHVVVGLPDRNPLNIDWDPAPPPEKGPPLSRGASRDKSLLGAQIGAILGAYVLFVSLLGVFLAVVGRRLRADALTARAPRDVEMVKQAVPPPLPAAAPPKAFDPSPISGITASPDSGQLATNFSWPSPTKQEFSAFDERLIQEDREKRERDMERLYAAVMEHEAANEASAESRRHGRQQAPTSSPRAPPPLSIPKNHGSGGGTTPKLKSPSLLRALTSPKLKLSPEKKEARNSESGSGSSGGRRSRSRPPSLTSTDSSQQRKGSVTGGIRGMTISSPVPTPTFGLHSRHASDEEPLTPRYPPPTPPPAFNPSPMSSYSRSRQQSSTTINNTYPTAASSPAPAPLAPLKTSRALAAGYPPMNTSVPTLSSASSSTYSLKQSPVSQPASPTSSSTLPLRSLNATLNTHHPSGHTTKVTILERSSPLVGGGGGPGQPLRTGASLLSPGSAVPYTPYMPFTPVTPITPGLVSRKERKARENMGDGGGGGADGGAAGQSAGAGGTGRRRRVVTELSKGEDELWDGGY